MNPLCLTLSTVLSCGLVHGFAHGPKIGQTEARLEKWSAQELINFIVIHQPEKQWPEDILGCGADETTNARRAAAKELLKRGDSVVAEIEAELAVLNQTKDQSRITANADWLLCVYAAIRGAESVQAIVDFSGVAGLSRPLVRSAISMALQITSFVPSTLASTSGNRIRCRQSEPRDALDDLILSWMRGDELLLRQALGPRGRIALDKLLEGSTLAAFRDGRQPPLRDASAVGYRLGTKGKWSEPIETLSQARVESWASDSRFAVQTEFVDRDGRVCGSMQIEFRASPVSPDDELTAGLLKTYEVDNNELGDLLQLISRCASGGIRLQ